MLVIDTNILVYAADWRSEFHARCQQLIDGCRQGATPWYLTWGICYEFLRVCTQPAVLSKQWSIAAAWNFLEIILDCPSAGLLLPTSQHAAALAETITEVPHLRGNILHDAHTVVLMREHGIREIYPRDTDFHRFPFIEVIDPLA